MSRGKVRLRLSTERWSLLSALIRWRGESKHSHVEFEYEDGFTLGARFSLRGKFARWRGWPYSWLRLDGVQFRPPQDNRKQVNVLLLTFDDIEKASEWGYQNRWGAPYDLMGILGIVTARGWADSRDCFCSEFVAECAGAVNNPLQACAPQAVQPRDVEISPKVRPA